MECKFTIGQKIVCVNDDDDFAPRNPNIKQYRDGLDGLTKGKIYTIRSMTICQAHGVPCVLLEEIVRKKSTNGSFGPNTEVGFFYARFAPVKENKSDISVFTEILNKVGDGNHDNDYDFCLDELFETVNK